MFHLATLLSPATYGSIHVILGPSDFASLEVSGLLKTLHTALAPFGLLAFHHTTLKITNSFVSDPTLAGYTTLSESADPIILRKPASSETFKSPTTATPSSTTITPLPTA